MKEKVLYVDDEPINLQLFEINFEDKYDVITALSGMQGLELLNKHTDMKLVISDMKMPVMNGIEFIKTAKKKHPNLSYFILTGFEITDEIQEAINSHLILRYFRKPFNIREIESAIKEALSQ